MAEEKKNHRMIDTPLSEGIRNLGVSTLYRYVRALPQKLVIVEVGSGNGYILSLLQKRFRSRIVLGVDPKPNSFRLHWGLEKEPLYQAPQFSFVKDLIREKPDIQANCVLLINWSDPSTTYDIEAIQLLQPCFVLALVETNSQIAGSPLFMKFLEQSGVSMLSSHKSESKKDNKLSDLSPYCLIHSSTAYSRAEITGWSIQCKLVCLESLSNNNYVFTPSCSRFKRKCKLKIKAPSCINKIMEKETLLKNLDPLTQQIYDCFLNQVVFCIQEGFEFQWFCEIWK